MNSSRRGIHLSGILKIPIGHRVVRGTLCLLLLSWSSFGHAATIEINELLAPVTPGTEAPDTWYLQTTGAGTGSLVDFIGQGGNLEFSQPLGQGAAQLTTGPSDVNDRVRIYMNGDFGAASSVLTGIDLAFSYYKESVGANAPAPSLRLVVYSPDSGLGGSDTDSFGELVFEPYWNQPAGGASNPPVNTWQNVVIDENTGAAGNPNPGDDTGTAGFWWSGGFGQPNGFGGPDILSLAEWESLFSADADFANARIVGFSLGLGTYNLGQVNYFDQVSITIPGGIDTTYNFEPIIIPPAPEPSTLLLALLGMCGVGLRRRRRS